MITEDQLREVSINGRFALGVCCLEDWCRVQQLDSPNLKSLIKALWTYTSATDLSQWERSLVSLLPENVSDLSNMIMPHHLSEQQLGDLYNLIDNIWEIGTGNLYGGVKQYFTLDPTLEVINLLEQYDVPLPDFAPFLKSPFSENHGWGNRYPADVFRKKVAKNSK